MYENESGEDGWEEQQQKPESEEEGDGQPTFQEKEGDALLNVPADHKKVGAIKKNIPKWQWGVLAGFGVVAIGGGVAFALLGGHPAQGANPLQGAHPLQAATGANPEHRPSPARFSSPRSSPVRAPLQGATTAPPFRHTAGSGGFATLHEFSTSAQAPSAPVGSSVLTTPALRSVDALPDSSVNKNQASSVVPADVSLLKAQVADSKTEIAILQKELQAEKAMTVSERHAAAAPRVITRTIVRYVHVPVAAPSRPASSRAPVSNAAQPPVGLNGWKIIGGNVHAAILSSPNGQVRMVRLGDVLPGAGLVQRVTLGKVITTGGVIR